MVVPMAMARANISPNTRSRLPRAAALLLPDIVTLMHVLPWPG